MAQILVVDDNSLFNETLCANLETSGHVCASASNVTDALAVLGTHQIDLVLTDHDMPMENGLTLIKTMKRQPKLEPIPIILMPGIPDSDLMDLAKKHGAFAAIPKPFDIDFLLRAVAQALASKPGESMSSDGKE